MIQPGALPALHALGRGVILHYDNDRAYGNPCCQPFLTAAAGCQNELARTFAGFQSSLASLGRLGRQTRVKHTPAMDLSDVFHILQQEWQAIPQDLRHTLPALLASCDAQSSIIFSSLRIFGVAHFWWCHWYMVVVFFSSHARIWGESLTLHSLPALFFFFLSGD